ncbi:hypothetical protein FSARC_2138 [Fusarium sarcochroum]|uniref:Uncharacterized protein n=1 Tax=Fusarium sarcochroum TaxID=1208366 RepID=A0A8H4U738_9HYPO|nr:hypothetical protein FSARC_2138 [Fusarium sarcochroum]
MTLRRKAVEQDFGLRPQAGPSTITRPSVPIKHNEDEDEENEPSPAETNLSLNATESTQEMPVRKPSRALLAQAHDSQGDDRSSTISPTNVHKDLPLPPASNNKLPKRRRSNESQKSSDGENPTLPSHFPPCPIERPLPHDIAHWHEGCRAVQRPDGTINAREVVNWSMTRKGGVANPWPQLNEGLKAIEDMRKDMIDPAEILRRHQEEEEAARAKEERRQAFKRRYRPRGQVDKERAERRAAALAAKQAQEKLEEAGSATVQEGDVGDT